MGLIQQEVTTEEKLWFNRAGTFFLVVQLVIVSAILFDPDTRLFLWWSCNNFCFFLAIACYLKRMQLVKGISYVGLLTQMLWGADFVSPYFGYNVSGISDYAAIGGLTYINTVSISVHMFVPLVVLAFSFRIRPGVRSLVYSVPYVFILFFTTLAFTPAAEDINCVFSGCNLSGYIPFNPPYSVWLWPVYAMLAAFLGYVVHWILYYGWHDVIGGRRHRRI